MCNCNKLYVVDWRSDLYAVDPNTASSALVGPVGILQVTDIASYKGALYGITFTDFLLIDPNSGRGTVVGPLGVTGSNNGLAVNSKGEIFMSGGTELYKIDPSTGAATLIGSNGMGLISMGDLAFDSNDVLYGILGGGSAPDVIVQLDVNTGVASSAVSTGLFHLYGLDFCCCNLYAGSFDGKIYRVNLGTANLEFVGQTPHRLNGMTCGSCC
jgi:hypothetical protein